jgi:hypothetical protein
MFVTFEGHFGFGPESLQSGDVLCKFRNTTVPQLLRKLSAHSTKHHFYVGECLGVPASELEEYLRNRTPSWNPPIEAVAGKLFSIF